MWEALKSVDPHTWARSVCFILALINQALAVFGKGQIEFVEDDVYQLVSLIATFVTGAFAWWKNNSFTPNAQAADRYLHELRACAKCEGGISVEGDDPHCVDESDVAESTEDIQQQ